MWFGSFAFYCKDEAVLSLGLSLGGWMAHATYRAASAARLPCLQGIPGTAHTDQKLIQQTSESAVAPFKYCIYMGKKHWIFRHSATALDFCHL